MDYNEKESSCRFKDTCHFYNISSMTPNSSHMKELYCMEWPEQCAIYQAKVRGLPVPITLWPKGKVTVG